MIRTHLHPRTWAAAHLTFFFKLGRVLARCRLAIPFSLRGDRYPVPRAKSTPAERRVRVPDPPPVLVPCLGGRIRPFPPFSCGDEPRIPIPSAKKHLSQCCACTGFDSAERDGDRGTRITRAGFRIPRGQACAVCAPCICQAGGDQLRVHHPDSSAADAQCRITLWGGQWQFH